MQARRGQSEVKTFLSSKIFLLSFALVDLSIDVPIELMKASSESREASSPVDEHKTNPGNKRALVLHLVATPITRHLTPGPSVDEFKEPETVLLDESRK